MRENGTKWIPNERYMPDHSGRPSGEEMTVNGGILRLPKQTFWFAISVALWLTCFVYVRRKPGDRSRLWYLWFASALVIVDVSPLLVNVIFRNPRLTVTMQGLSLLGRALLWVAWVILGILSLFQKSK